MGPRTTTCLVLAAAALGALCGSPAAQAQPVPEIAWGAYAAGGQYGLEDAPWDMRSASAFERSARKRMTLLQWRQAWFECSTSCGLRPFRAKLFERARARGYTPVLSWGSYDERRGANQPHFQLADITAGRYDRFVRAWARGAARWDHPFFLRFDWEMNTNGVPYSEHSNGNRRGSFVRMWRHVHRLFREEGATNARWVWCPNVQYRGSVKPLWSLYPGDTYVDWICLDGYNWGTDPARRDRWMSFDAIFRDTYALLTTWIAPSKPMMIGEMGSTEHGGSKAEWISDALAVQIPFSYPAVRAVVWFNKRWDGVNWPIESSPAARLAFADAISPPVYASR
jgi:mannan endo-1,4-beta-mannosidase